MTSPPAVADLAAAIIAEPAPIVFLDAAAILDILRASFRHEIKANVVESAVDLTEASVATPKRLWLVAPDIVMGEFDNHHEKVKKREGFSPEAVQRGHREGSRDFKDRFR